MYHTHDALGLHSSLHQPNPPQPHRERVRQHGDHTEREHELSNWERSGVFPVT